MDFMTAVKTVVLERYADFQGRSSRSEYWWFFLFNMLISVVVQVMAPIQGIGPIIAIVGLVISLGLLIPGIAVAIRRLHDIGKSGWWLLIGLVPFVGFIVLIYFFVQPSQQGSNDWGAEPFASGAETFE